MSIIVIEPECRGWNHEQVNIAWIKMLRKACPAERIVFWAEEGHVSAVQKKTNDLAIDYHICELPENSGDSLEYVDCYKEMFTKILEKEANEQKTKVLLLSSHKGNMKAILQLADTWIQCEFFIVLHAVVEQLIKKYSLKARIRGGKFYDGWMLRRIMNQLSCKKNVKFATFSPALVQSLHGYLKENTLDKICFIHHPYEYDKIEDKKKDGIINIGVMGATVNNYAMQIMKEVGHRTAKDNYIFTVVRSEQNFSGIRNVNLVNHGQTVSREQIDEECQKMDYMLVPYDNAMYRLSASGVFFDSINYEIPALMLDSPLLTFYGEKYNLGTCYSNVEELIHVIIGLIETNAEIDVTEQERIRGVKEKLKTENMQYLRMFMDI